VGLTAAALNNPDIGGEKLSLQDLHPPNPPCPARNGTPAKGRWGGPRTTFASDSNPLVVPPQVITSRSSAAASSFAIGTFTQIPVSAQAVESSRLLVPPNFGSLSRYSPPAQWSFLLEREIQGAGRGNDEEKQGVKRNASHKELHLSIIVIPDGYQLRQGQGRSDRLL
jgi:hypothetical protein